MNSTTLNVIKLKTRKKRKKLESTTVQDSRLFLKTKRDEEEKERAAKFATKKKGKVSKAKEVKKSEENTSEG